MTRDRLVRETRISQRDLNAVAFSPDGTLLATGGDDGFAYVVTSEGRVVARSEHHGDTNVWGVDWSPDGCKVASSATAGILLIWEARTGKVELRAQLPWGNSQCPRWSPDGRRIALGLATGPAFFDTRTSRIDLEEDAQPTYARGVAWSPDGLRVATSYDQHVSIWDVRTGLEVLRMDTDSSLSAVAWSPDGNKLAAGRRDGEVLIWNATTGERVLEQQTSDELFNIDMVAWSPDGRVVAACDAYSDTKLVDALTGQVLAVLSGAWWVAFSPGGHRCALACEDGFLKIYDVANLVVPRATRATPIPSASAYVARQAATVGRGAELPNDTTPLWVPRLPQANGRCLGVLTGPEDDMSVRVALIPGNRSAVTGHTSGHLRRWDLSSGTMSWELGGLGWHVRHFAVSPNGTRIASGFSRGIQFWDADTGRRLASGAGPADRFHGLSWSPDGHRIASIDYTAGPDTIRVWDPDTGAVVLTCGNHSEPPQGLDWSPDSRSLASGDNSGTAFLWDAHTGTRLAQWTPWADDRHVIWVVRWSPDGRHLAIGTQEGGVVVLRVADGAVVSQMRHEGGVSALAWSANGQFLASGCQEKHPIICIWEVFSGTKLEQFDAEGGCYKCAWSSDGAFIISGHVNGTVLIWDTRHLLAATASGAPSPRSTRHPATPITSGILPGIALLPAALATLLRHNRAAPLSLLHDLLELTGGQPLASEATALTQHPGARALRQLGWPTASRVALVLVLLRDYHDPAFALPPGVSPADIEAQLTATLAGPVIPAVRPPTPFAALTHALDAIEDRVLTLLSSLGPDTCAADPSLPLTLLPRLPDIAPLAAPERRLLALHLGSGEGRAHSSGAGHERAGLSPLGDVRSLLPSQWALPDQLRIFRYLQGGLLYRARTGREPPRLRPTVVVLDVSPPCFGPIERILRPAAHALASALLAASEPAYCIAAGGDNRVRPLQHPLDLVELCAARTLDPVDTARTLVQADQLARSLSGHSALEPVIVLFTQPWFGAEDRHVAAPPHLRALFVHYPGRPIEPAWHDRCERWEVVAPGATASVSDALGKLIA